MPSHTESERQKNLGGGVVTGGGLVPGGGLRTGGGGITPGGGLVTGGGVVTGGGLVTGGGVRLTGSIPGDHLGMYHKILGMKPHEWEYMRELSAQQTGFRPSSMWPKFPKEPMESSRHQYERIMRAHHPTIAAKQLENEHMSQKGSGFFSAIRHIARKAVKFLPTVIKWTSRFMQAAEIAKQMPVIGEFADKAGRVAGRINTGVTTLQSRAQELRAQARPLIKRAGQQISEQVQPAIARIKSLLPEGTGRSRIRREPIALAESQAEQP